MSFLWPFPFIPDIPSSEHCVWNLFDFFEHSRIYVVPHSTHTHIYGTYKRSLSFNPSCNPICRISIQRNWINYNNVWLHRTVSTRISNFRAIDCFQGFHKRRAAISRLLLSNWKSYWQMNWTIWTLHENGHGELASLYQPECSHIIESNAFGVLAEFLDFIWARSFVYNYGINRQSSIIIKSSCVTT